MAHTCGLGLGWCLPLRPPSSHSQVLLRCFVNKQAQLRNDDMELEDVWSDFAMEMIDLRPLVTNYRLGGAVSQDFSTKHRAANAAAFTASNFSGEVLAASEWFPTMLALFFIVYAGQLVLDAELDLGIFIAAYNTTAAFGSTLSR